MLSVAAACAVGPDFVRPTAPATDRYTREPTALKTVDADGRVQRFTVGAAVATAWWELFRSPPLNSVVQQALMGNPSLEASRASLEASQSNLRAGYGIFYPHIDASGEATRQRSEPALQGLRGPGSVYNLVTLGASVGYALDVFGGKRRTVEGLRARVDAARYARAAAYLTLSATVVNTAIARAAYAAEITATRQVIELDMNNSPPLLTASPLSTSN